MNLVGKWKAAKMRFADDSCDDYLYLNQDELREALIKRGDSEENINDLLGSFGNMLEFMEDGTYAMLIPAPKEAMANVTQEQIDKFVAEGMAQVVDGVIYRVEGGLKWKEENGQIFIEDPTAFDENNAWRPLETVEGDMIDYLLHHYSKM